MVTMLGIETLFISGLPANKLELIDGRVPCAMAFRTREEAEATFEHWVATVARWKEKPPATTRGPRIWKSAVAGYEIRLELRRLDVLVPFSGAAHYEFQMNFWDPALWPSGSGLTSFGAYNHAVQELTRALWPARDLEACRVCSRTDVLLTDRSVLSPGFYIFREGAWDWVGGKGNYLRGIPEVVVEVACPATHADDIPGTGRRATVLEKAGVRSYWLVDPGSARFLVHELDRGSYRLVEELRPGDAFRPRFPPGIELDISEIFSNRWEVPPVLVIGKRPADGDTGYCVPDEPLDLEHILLAGHPLRRYEILDDAAPCVLAYRDPAKARRDFEHWNRQAARLAGLTAPGKPGDTFEAGPFRLGHDGHRVHLDLHYRGELQRELLEVFSLPGVWDTARRGECESSEEPPRP